MLVEERQGDLLTCSWVPLVTQVKVIYVCRLKVVVTHNAAAKFKIVIDRGGEFAKLRTVYASSVCGPQLVLLAKLVNYIEGWEEVVIVVCGALQALLILTCVHLKHLAVIFVAHSCVDVKGSYREVYPDISRKLRLLAFVVVKEVYLLIEVELIGTIVFILEQPALHILPKEEACRKVVLRLPAILELPCIIGTCAVLSIDACL